MESGVTPARRENPLLALFSSVWFGIILLVLILIYACVGSAIAPIRGVLEMTEMQIFRHWLFRTLIALFCITLIVTTIRRVRFNLTNAGVWIVHTGLLLLCGGAAVYFGTKVEGDCLVRLPSIELLGPGGRVLRQLPARPNESFSTEAPFLAAGDPQGDATIKFKIDSIETAADGSLKSAAVRFQAGSRAIQSLNLEPGQTKTLVDQKLSARVQSFPPVTRFYDEEVPGIYYGPHGETRRFAALRGLPLHRERFVSAQPVYDSDGAVVASNRAEPAVTVGGVKVPTGWFEPWRLPIRPETPDLPFTVEVAGYVPYAEQFDSIAVAGGAEEHPGIRFKIDANETHADMSLFAEPSESLSHTGLPIEFHWVRSAAEVEALLAPMSGVNELTIQVLNPAVTKKVTVNGGQTIAVEGTPYTLKIGEVLESWPLASPGFENAVSPALRVDVAGGPEAFNRTIIQRFPQFTQDIDSKGKRHTEGLVDPNIVMTYRTAPNGWIHLIGGNDVSPVIGIIEPSGRVQRYPLQKDVPRSVELAAGNQVFAFNFTLVALEPKAQRGMVPVVTPVERRDANAGRNRSAILVRLKGQRELQNWQFERWIPYSNYLEMSPTVATVQTPDGRQWDLIFSRLQRELGFQVAAAKLTVDYFPGKQHVSEWRTDFRVQEPKRPAEDGCTYMNHTFAAGNWTLYQATAATDGWSWSGLGVGNRQGIWPMLLGCILIPLGSLYAFYIKPALIAARKRRALEEARATGRVRNAVPEPELVDSVR